MVVEWKRKNDFASTAVSGGRLGRNAERTHACTKWWWTEADVYWLGIVIHSHRLSEEAPHADCGIERIDMDMDMDHGTSERVNHWTIESLNDEAGSASTVIRRMKIGG